jgi:hypothetical protein
MADESRPSERREDDEPHTLEEMLDRIGEAEPEEGDRVTLDAVLDVVGRRSFGPLLVAAGVVILVPLVGDIPGVPVLVGLVVLLVSVQLLFRRDHIWLPRWMLKRSVARDKLCKGLGWLRHPARFVDRLLRPRLTVLTRGPAIYVLGATCILVAAATPVMEFVPFSATIAGAVLTAFGLALIARDGALAVTAFVLTAGGLGWVGYELLRPG